MKRCLLLAWPVASIAIWTAQPATANPADTHVLHVATNGNDTWSGRLARPTADKSDGPLATLAGARDAVRKLKAQTPLTQPLHVRLAGGIYLLAWPLDFGPADSGTATAPVIYEAAPGATPVITGGRPASGWHTAKDGIWCTTVPEVKAGKWWFEQLWINGRRTLAVFQVGHGPALSP